nr:hypothetical protein [Tanacetum cinerariifolium]
KEHARLSVSTGKHQCVSTAGRRIDEVDAPLDSTGPKRKKQKLHAVGVEQMRMPGALSSEGNDYPRNLTASNVRNKARAEHFDRSTGPDRTGKPDGTGP